MQMGNQRRSWPNINEAMKLLHDGIIGEVYYGKAGMPTIEIQLAMEKWYLFHPILIGNYGRVLLRVKIIVIISFTTTGTGSGIGARANRATTAHMKLIVCAGRLALIILPKWFPVAAVMLIKMTGKRPIRK